MNIYLLKREDYIGYDEYKGFIIEAKTVDDAVLIANEASGEEGEIWAHVPIIKVGKSHSTNRGILLGSVNAG